MPHLFRAFRGFGPRLRYPGRETAVGTLATLVLAITLMAPSLGPGQSALGADPGFLATSGLDRDRGAEQPGAALALNAGFNSLLNPSPEPAATASPAVVVAAVPLSSPMVKPAAAPTAHARLFMVRKPKSVAIITHGGSGWHTDYNVSFYGPKLYGHRTACGLALTTTLVGVANRTLPCGTLVTFRNPANGRTVTAPVVDRGPYVWGRYWDLTGGLCEALQMCHTGTLQWHLH